MVRLKYPRTFHLPWSDGVQSDDKIISTLDAFKGRHVIVSRKMDGENTSLASTYMHARSVDSKHHPSRDWVKQFWSTFAHYIPEGMIIAGENMYAKHSIAYDSLPSYFLGFGVWDNSSDIPILQDWATTIWWFNELGIQPVEVIYDGKWDESVIKSLWNPEDGHEGYVVRVADAIPLSDFSTHVAKFVRANHVQTNKHWRNQEIIPNLLKSES